MSDIDHHRRAVLGGALAFGAGLPLLGARAATEDDPKKARPQEGDRFVFFSGDRKGEIIRVEDLPVGGPQVLAYRCIPPPAPSETDRASTRSS